MSVLGISSSPVAAESQPEAEATQTDNGLAPSDLDPRPLEVRMAETLALNPGSIRLSENEILLEPGAIMTFPLDGETTAHSPGEPVGTQASGDCPPYYLCGWKHIDFTGPRLSLYECRYYDLRGYWYLDWETGRFETWAYKISSEYNHQVGTVRPAEWYAANGYTYYSPEGSLNWWVGDFWNDQFYAAWTC